MFFSVSHTWSFASTAVLSVLLVKQSYQDICSEGCSLGPERYDFIQMRKWTEGLVNYHPDFWKLFFFLIEWTKGIFHLQCQTLKWSSFIFKVKLCVAGCHTSNLDLGWCLRFFFFFCFHFSLRLTSLWPIIFSCPFETFNFRILISSQSGLIDLIAPLLTVS